MPMYYEDFAIGYSLKTRGRTVGEADITLFAGLVGDFTPIHVDAHAAQSETFGARIAHGTLTMSMALGLMSQLDLFDGTVLGLLNLNWNFSAPVMIGDTLYATVTAIEKRTTSKPGQGIVKLRIDVLNQQGRMVQQGVSTTLIKMR